MIRRLGRRLRARTTFVVGKGGVGKTTTAGALALALADDGTPTHLLSTDPAHSLRDLFDHRERGPATFRPCGGLLTAEEPDAAAVATARLAALEPALKELVERGTYLDEADAASLLEGSLPGLDEIGAALRVAALHGRTRLVVDTAPTGHTLRLLDLTDTLAGWIAVFRAMGEKAGAVASALLRRPVQLTADEALDALEAELRAFREATRAADYVVVAGTGDVVRAETSRLRAELDRRGLRVAATVAVDRPGAEADLLLPARPGLSGCEALRAWSRASAAPSGGAGRADRRAGSTAAPAGAAASAAKAGAGGGPGVPPALDRELVVFAGKGGVGKTTCAAAAAVVLADRGPVVLLSADPAGSLAEVLPAGAPGVRVEQVDPAAELDRFGARYRAEVERVFEAVGLDRAARLDRAVVERLWELAPPGVDEVIAVTRLADERVDAGERLVLDTAPTGHFLRLLAMPGQALDWTHRLMRILLKYRALGGLDAPAEPLIRFAKRLKALRERLSDPSRTAIILVSLDEPMVRAETQRLADRLRRLGLPAGSVLINRAEAHATPAGADLVAPLVPEPIGPERLRSFVAAWRPAA